MNQIIGLLLFCFFLGSSFAQNINQSNIPAVVVNAFQIKYPNAKEVVWKMDRENYRVDFKLNGTENKMVIDYKGGVLIHARDLIKSEIPSAVLETVRKKLGIDEFADADKVSVADQSVTYELRIVLDGKDNFFWISETGELKKYRKELHVHETPSAILKYLRDHYPLLVLERSKYVEDGGNINYIVGGRFKEKEQVFNFDRNSRLLKHTRVLWESEIPAPVLSYFRSKYKNVDIGYAKLEEVAGVNTYLLERKNSKDVVQINYSPGGKVKEIK